MTYSIILSNVSFFVDKTTLTGTRGTRKDPTNGLGFSASFRWWCHDNSLDDDVDGKAPIRKRTPNIHEQPHHLLARLPSVTRFAVPENLILSDVRQQPHKPRAKDCLTNCPLVLCTISGTATR